MPLAFCTSMSKNLHKLTQLKMIKGVRTTFATKEIVEMCWIGYTSFNVPSLLKFYIFFPHALITKDALRPMYTPSQCQAFGFKKKKSKHYS